MALVHLGFPEDNPTFVPVMFSTFGPSTDGLFAHTGLSGPALTTGSAPAKMSRLSITALQLALFVLCINTLPALIRISKALGI